MLIPVNEATSYTCVCWPECEGDLLADSGVDG